jgi:hypothetical protein
MIHEAWEHVSLRMAQEWHVYTCDLMNNNHMKRYLSAIPMAEEAMGRYCRARIRGCIAFHFIALVGRLADELLIELLAVYCSTRLLFKSVHIKPESTEIYNPPTQNIRLDQPTTHPLLLLNHPSSSPHPPTWKIKKVPALRRQCTPARVAGPGLRRATALLFHHLSTLIN